VPDLETVAGVFARPDQERDESSPAKRFWTVWFDPTDQQWHLQPPGSPIWAFHTPGSGPIAIRAKQHDGDGDAS
jgi:hypothetical protein